MRTFSTITLAIITLVSITPVESTYSGSAYTNWSREVLQIPTDSEAQRKPFYVGVTTALDDRLIALCQYRNTDPGRSKLLHGRKDEDGKFWPVVSYEVSVAGTSEWREISAAQESTATDTSVIASGETIVLYVSATPFRQFIGTSRWGRLILDRVISANFLLEDLLPPAGRRGGSRDFKEELEHVEQPRFGSAAILYSITFLDGVLTGDFLYVRNSASVLDGIRTAEGDFWPNVSLFVGESTEDWHTIGTSSAPGTPTSIRRSIDEHSPLLLRVKLDPFRPRIGQDKYGKIVFSDGSFAVFLIEHLNPSTPEQRLPR
jgi:hypothetical protein